MLLLVFSGEMEDVISVREFVILFFTVRIISIFEISCESYILYHTFYTGHI